MYRFIGSVRFSVIARFASAGFVALAAVLVSGCFNYVQMSLMPPAESAINLEKVQLYTNATDSRNIGNVLLIPVEGEIVNNLEPGAVYPGRIERLFQAAADDSIDAILVKVNSPGGSAFASDTLYRMIENFGKQKNAPVFVHIDGLGASGGYYVAMAGSNVNASPVSLVGSIGVIIRTFGVLGLMDKVGVEYRSVKSGKNKDILSPFAEITDEQKQSLQKQINANYETFLTVIRNSRKSRISDELLRKIADGNIYDAAEAKKFGLIDSTLYVEDYLSEIGRQLNVSKVNVYSYLPQGRKDYNIYNTGMLPSVSPEAKLMRMVRSGIYYIYEGGL